MQTILVIEDNEGFRQFLVDFLSWRSHNILEAKDGLEGWQLAIAQKPDLILSDTEMPRLNGYELLEKLQQDLDLAMIPVILISGMATADARSHTLQLGAADFLGNTTLPDKILGTISICLKRSSLPEPQRCKHSSH
jgi:CheY-like chemotaxis protein